MSQDEITLTVGGEDKPQIRSVEQKSLVPAIRKVESVNVMESAESVDTAVEQYVAQPDTLMIQDEKKVKDIQLNFDELARVIRALPGLTPLQRRIIELRFLYLLRQYHSRLFYIDFFYHFSRGFVALGGVLVPALLSIQSPTNNNSVSLYWTTWGISLLVTILHNFTTIFRFEKKYFTLHTVTERLKTEGWQYFELSGRYSGHHGHRAPTHENQFVYFVNTIEKIRLRQIEDEYSSAKEAGEKQPGIVQTPPQPATKTTTVSEQAVPSPMDLQQNRAIKPHS